MSNSHDCSQCLHCEDCNHPDHWHSNVEPRLCVSEDAFGNDCRCKGFK